MIEAFSITIGAFLGMRIDLRAIRRYNRRSCVIYAMKIAGVVERKLYIKINDVKASRRVCSTSSKLLAERRIQNRGTPSQMLSIQKRLVESTIKSVTFEAGTMAKNSG